MGGMTRSVLLVVGLLASLALAAPPRRSPAVLGSAREEAPCPAPAPDADAAFTRALLWAFEPAPLEVRTQAIEDLGLLGDARALNPLAQLALDANGVLARAALRAIATLRHPRAEEILANVVRHGAVHENNRLYALHMLPYQATWSALRAVRTLAEQASLPGPVRQAARDLALTLPARPASAPVAPPRPAPLTGDEK